MVLDPSQEPTPSSYGERLDWLLRTVRPHPGESAEYSMRGIARWVSTQRRVKLSVAGLSLARSDQRGWPDHRVVEALADFFGVPMDFFGADEAAVRHAMETIVVQYELQGPPRTAAELRPTDGDTSAPGGRRVQPVRRATVDVSDLSEQQREAVRAWVVYLSGDETRELPVLRSFAAH